MPLNAFRTSSVIKSLSQAYILLDELGDCSPNGQRVGLEGEHWRSRENSWNKISLIMWQKTGERQREKNLRFISGEIWNVKKCRGTSRWRPEPRQKIENCINCVYTKSVGKHEGKLVGHETWMFSLRILFIIIDTMGSSNMFQTVYTWTCIIKYF